MDGRGDATTITLAQFFKSILNGPSLFDQIEQEGSMRSSINKNTSLFVLWFLYEVGGREGGSKMDN